MGHKSQAKGRLAEGWGEGIQEEGREEGLGSRFYLVRKHLRTNFDAVVPPVVHSRRITRPVAHANWFAI